MFAELARSISEAWRQAQGVEEAFPRIATDHLRDSRLLETLDYANVVRWLLAGVNVPPQDTYEFGQPPIIVHAEAGFYIQVLFWLDATTTIHQHGFGGAFGVLHGSSLHSTYRFACEDDRAPNLLSGRLEHLSSELLERGAVRSIEPGHMIHALFHLDRPSVSVVVRTWGSERQRRQYDYLKPGLATDSRYTPALPTIQLRMLTCLLSTDLPAFWPAAANVIAHGSSWMLYRVLAIAFPKADQESDWHRLLDTAEARHGRALVRRVIACLEASACEHRIVSLRASIHDATHRFFLALLLSVPHRDAIYALIRQRFPGADPESLALRWLGEIFAESRAGLKLTPLTVHLLRLALRHGEFDAARPSLGHLVRAGREREDEERLRETWRKLMAVDLLQPLLTQAEPRAETSEVAV